MATCWYRDVVVLVLVLAAAVEANGYAGGDFKVGFYGQSCSSAESIVYDEVKSAFQKNPGLAAGLIRLHFHDCFVNGCDGSVLIDSTPPSNIAEKDSPANNPSLRGFEVIDSAKSRLEQVCPGTVSCADILAFAARDSSRLASGSSLASWNVKGGRRDSRISRAADIRGNLPSPADDVQQLTQNFANKGLSQKDMVILSGAHSIGVSHCNALLLSRLYNFNSSHPTDPSLDPVYAEILKAKCPPGSTNNDMTTFVMDPSTPDVLDKDYYTLVLSNKGLFGSDATLLTHPHTRWLVRQNAASNTLFWSQFAHAMAKMGEIGVLSGGQGEIRRNCRVIN